MCTQLQPAQPSPREGYIANGSTELYYRETGAGPSIFVLHGGPAFDHSYLLPDMDRLSDSFRLIYYDQRGRGRSARNVEPGDVSINSEVEDLERLRESMRLDSVAVLGHSWGGLLGLEYALRHPNRVSHLILMNTAPASHAGYLLFRQERRKRAAADLEALGALSSSAGYEEGDPDTLAECYRIYFRSTLKRPEHLEGLIGRLRSSFTREGILKARAIGERLMNETWLSGEYNLLPGLERLWMPALILHGDHDFIPVECAENIARAIPRARLVVFEECGHFSYIDSPDDVRSEITDFITPPARGGIS